MALDTFGSQSAPFQASSNASDFMSLTTPVHLPILVSTNGAHSVFLPEAPHAQAPAVVGYTDVPPERAGVDFGQIDYFKYINNDNDVLKSCELVVQLAPLAASGAGKLPRYADDVLCQAIDFIEWQYGGKTLQTLAGDRIHFDVVQETEQNELMRKYKLQAAEVHPNQRAALAQNPQWVRLEIPWWWTKSASAAWHQYALQRQTRLIVHWRDPSYILQQDEVNGKPTPAVGSTYIMNHWLRFQVSAITEATKQEYLSRVKAKGDNGMLYMFPDTQSSLQNPANAGDATTLISLNTFNKYAYNMRLFVRPVANLNADYTNNRRFDVVDVGTLKLDLSGKTYLPLTDRDYLKYEINGKKFLGNPELSIFNIPLATDNPDIYQHGLGGFDLTNVTTPQLTITPPGAAGTTWGADYFVDVYVYCHNLERISIAGNRSAAEVVQPL